MPRTYGYMRVSTADQNLDRQEQALKDYGCDRIYREKVTGAGSWTTRQSLRALIERLEPGDKIVVLSIDRLGRSTPDLIAIVEEIRARGAQFVSLTQGIDTTTAAGQLFYTIFAAMAEFERKMIAERRAQGMEARRRKGLSAGGRPPKLTPAVLTRIREMAERNRTTGDIAEELGISDGTVRRAYRILSGSHPAPVARRDRKKNKNSSAIAADETFAQNERAL